MSNNIYSHPFVREALNNNKAHLAKAVELLGKSARESGRFTSLEPQAISPKTYYHQEILRSSSNLLSTVDRLDEIHLYITETTPDTKLRENGITPDKWIRYHYRNHIITLASTYDIALILVSRVFNLGIPPKHCKEGAIVDNERVKHTDVAPALRKLKKAAGQHAQERNQHLHHGVEPYIDAINDLTVFDFVQHASPEAFTSSEKECIAHAYSAAIDEIELTLSHRHVEILGEIAALYDTLLPVYRQHSSSFNRTELAKTSGDEQDPQATR